MVVLVTGAGGFLGSRLVRRLLADGHSVKGVDRIPLPPPISDLGGLSWIERDLSREMLSSSELSGVETVFHLAGATLGAGQDEHMFHTANETTTISLLKACVGRVNRILYASSQVVYGNVNNLSVSESFPLEGLDSAYACSKVNAENWLRWFQLKGGGEFVILRLCGFVEGGGAITYMVDKALQDEPIELFSGGQICRDYLPVGAGIEAFLAASHYKVKNGFDAFNIGSGQVITATDLAKVVCTAAGSTSKIVLLEKRAARSNFVFDITKARIELGFEPDPLIDAVRSYVQVRMRRGNEG